MRVKTEAKRQAIIDVAAEVFREQGYERASMSEISARLGGSKATLYSYFKSKEELMGAVMAGGVTDERAREVFSTLSQRIYDSMGEESDDLRARLERFAVAFGSLIFTPDIIALRRMVISQGDRSGFSQTFYERGPLVGFRLLGGFLESLMDAGLLRRAEPWVAAMHLKSLIESEYFDQAMSGYLKAVTPEMVRDAAKRAVDVFWRAYAANDRPQ
jgi:AcrR family transcriptional regulator